MRKRLIRTGTAIITIMALTLQVGVVQAVAVPAHAFGAKWDGADGLDTRRSATWSASRLHTAGYTDAVNTTTPTSWGAVANAKGDGIWAAYGHANQGFITFYNPTNGSTVLRADASTGGCDGVSRCLSKQDKALFHDIRLMVFGGCHTAEPWGDAHTLQAVAKNTLGVDSSIAFLGLISWPAMDYWSDGFFLAATPRSGYVYTISEAAGSGQENAWRNVGYYGGTNNWRAFGGTVKIMPVAFGS